MKTLELYVPRVTIHIVKTPSIHEFMKEFIKEFPEFRIPSPACSALVCQDYEVYGPIHWMIFKKKPLISSVAHESLHVVEKISYAYNIFDEEFKAYLIGYLVEQITKK